MLDLFDDSPSNTIEATVSQQQSSYQKPTYNNSGGQQWQRKPDVVSPPYLPIAIYIDKDFPQEVKDKLYGVASKLISKGYTIRYNADDRELHPKLQDLSSKNTEAYVPFKGFNEVDTRHYFNTLTSKHMAQENFPAYEKVPGVVQSLLARNIRMLFGDKNNSCAMEVITWSPDGVIKSHLVTKETGRASFIIQVASKYGFGIVNINNKESVQRFVDATGIN